MPSPVPSLPNLVAAVGAVAAVCVASAVALAPAGAPLSALRLQLAAACAVLGIGVAWALRRFAMRRMARLQAEQAAENLRFDTAINNISQGLCFYDGSQRLIVCNRRYAQMYGLTQEQVRPGTTLKEIVDRRFERGSFPAMTRDEYLVWRASIAVSRAASDTVTTLQDGRIFAIHHEPMPDGGWVATHEDITVQRRAQAQIEKMARSDALTDLPNRMQFREQLDALLQPQAHGAGDGAGQVREPFALMLVDLDRFKAVNDTLGHPAGDALLAAAAQRLRACVRPQDLVARLGGDEFAIVQAAAEQPAAASSLAERVVSEFARPFDIGGHSVQVGASVGVSLAPQDGASSDELLIRADLALYDAKSSGRGTHRRFCAAMIEQAQRRRTLEADLREAQARGELELHYQPIVDMRTRHLLGFEALLRWRHPKRGLVMPDSFIPLAEETGLIDSIGAWVLQRALAQAMQWPRHLSIAVNLSPVQLEGAALCIAVQSALAASGLDARRVELEITESVRLAEDSANLALLHALQGLGVRICLDDFGVGYSSLSYLRSFPFKKIKIDRSFVRDVTTSAEAAAIVRAITALGASLGMAITAEGIESAEQLALLRTLGCDEAQGYFIGRPGAADSLEHLLQADRGLRLVAAG